MPALRAAAGAYAVSAIRHADRLILRARATPADTVASYAFDISRRLRATPARFTLSAMSPAFYTESPRYAPPSHASHTNSVASFAACLRHVKEPRILHLHYHGLNRGRSSPHDLASGVNGSST